MHLLVTGGAGFIGSNFVRFVMRQRPSWSITNLDSLSYSGNLENLSGLESDPRYAFVKGDVCDAALVHSLVERADAVVHMAAESHVDRSILDSRPFVVSNTLGTQTVLDACRRAKRGGSPWPGRLVYVSTDEVYGSLPLDKPELKFHEHSPLEPNSPYAASKAAGDLLVRAYCRTFKLNAVVTRCSNNFGPYQFPEKVIPLFVTNLLEGLQVPLYGDGLNVRDWVHVDDHCEAVLTALERGRAGEAYNIGGDNERSNLELTHTILKLMGKGEEMIRYVPDRLGHDRRYAIDEAKMARELGWKASRSVWPDALAATIEWYRANPLWWKRVKSGEYREYYQRQYGSAGGGCAGIGAV
jgi:dTDP-glucose 4,6-dehydratase